VPAQNEVDRSLAVYEGYVHVDQADHVDGADEVMGALTAAGTLPEPLERAVAVEVNQ
jgi:hypothetical protein